MFGLIMYLLSISGSHQGKTLYKLILYFLKFCQTNKQFMQNAMDSQDNQVGKGQPIKIQNILDYEESKNFSYEILSHKQQTLFQEQLESQFKQYKKQNKHNSKANTRNGIEQYEDYFGQVEQQVNKRIASCNQQTLSKIQHKIVIMDNKNGLDSLINFNQIKILKIGSQYSGLIMKYEVLVSDFKISIDLLNRNKKDEELLIELAKGGYGTVYRFGLGQKSIVCKRIPFKDFTIIQPQNENSKDFPKKGWMIQPNPEQIQDIIKEYSIYKICSFYKIGPSVVNCLGFDLVCFSSYIEFYMEQCFHNYKTQNIGQLNLLKVCVRLLHKMKIIHKDLKPLNILYSETYGQYVVCDFGISQSVQEKPGQLSKTYKQGTLGYLSEQMDNLEANKVGYIDLYYNDLHALKICVDQLTLSFNSLDSKMRANSNHMRRINYGYLGIKLLYMLINSDQLNTIQFIKQNKLERIFFKNLGYLHKFLHKYRQIAEILIKEQPQLVKYYEENNQILFEPNKHLETYQIQYFVRVYGMTAQLIEEMKKYPSNQRIERIKVFVNSNQKRKLQRLESIEILKVTAQSLKYIKSLERKLQYIRKQYKGQEQQLEIQIMFTLFNLKIEYPAYFTQVQQLHEQLLLYSDAFQQNQQVEYQIYSIILKSIKSKHRDNLRIKELFTLFPEYTLRCYFSYLKIMLPYFTRSEIEEEYEILSSLYGQIKSYGLLEEYIETVLKIINQKYNRTLFENIEDMINHLEMVLIQQNYYQRYNLSLLLQRGKQYYMQFRTSLAIEILQKCAGLIKQIYGQNHYKLLQCNVLLGRLYYLAYDYTKAQNFLLECVYKIPQFYGQFNQEFGNCLIHLIYFYDIKLNFKQVLVYYHKWSLIPYKFSIRYSRDVCQFYINMISSCFAHGFQDLGDKIYQQAYQRYKSYDTELGYYYYLIIKRVYYEIKYGSEKQEEIHKEIKELLNIESDQPIRYHLLILMVKDGHENEPNRVQFQEAQKILLYIQSRIRKQMLIYNYCILQLGRIYLKNGDFQKAYHQFKKGYEHFKKFGFQNLQVQIFLVYSLSRCMIQFNKIDIALKILIQVYNKVLKFVKFGQFQLFHALACKIALCYSKLGKDKKAKKLLKDILSDFKQNRICIKQKYQGDEQKYLLINFDKQVFNVQFEVNQNLYTIYKRAGRYIQAIYHCELLNRLNNTIADKQQNIYLLYYKKYHTKKYKALQHEIRVINFYRNNDCVKHSILIYYYYKMHQKITAMILVTFLFEVLCRCKVTVQFEQLYQFYQKLQRYNICKQIIQNGRILHLKGKMSQVLKKISMHKKIEYLNRKLQLCHKMQPHPKKYKIM